MPGGITVSVESKSEKVGDLRVPEWLIERMHASNCTDVELSIDARVALLRCDYRHFVTDTAAFCTRLDALHQVRGNEVVNGWQDPNPRRPQRQVGAGAARRAL